MLKVQNSHKSVFRDIFPVDVNSIFERSCDVNSNLVPKIDKAVREGRTQTQDKKEKLKIAAPKRD
jgi:hypothetical protein